jgi:hypothetical protein
MHIAVVSQHRWATKIHAAQFEMTSRPGTYRSLCGKSWQIEISDGQKFEAVPLADRCERCEAAIRVPTAA